MALVAVGDGRHLGPGMLANVEIKVVSPSLRFSPLQHKLWAILKEKNAMLISEHPEMPSRTTQK